MQDRTLDQAEVELLGLIRQLYAEQGRPFLRSRLSVVGRGRGLEVARTLSHLKTKGFVEEFERKPMFLLRLLGVKPVSVLRPTEPPAEQPTDALADLSPELHHETSAAPGEVHTAAPLHAAQGYETAGVTGQAPPAAAPVAVARGIEEIARQITPEFAAPEPFTPQTARAPVGRIATEVDEETEVEVAQPAMSALALEDAPIAAEHEEPVPAPAASPAANPVERPHIRPAAPPAPRPVRFAPDAYTDEVGGKPLQPAAKGNAVDPEVLEGLYEMLQLLGLEVTMAGEALITDRLSKGLPSGETLLQVVLFAFVHAVRYDLMSEAPVAAGDLRDYAAAVMAELDKLRDLGVIEAEVFARDIGRIALLADKEAVRGPLLAELLADPIGGAAPPALLPEELRGLAEEDDE